jgi:hypothetical protein
MLAAALIATGATAAEDDPPFKIDKREFEKNIKSIALAPTESDPYLPLSEAVKAMLEQEVRARLEKRGYQVLPSTVLAGIRAEMTAQVGGAQGPESGQPDGAALSAVREHAFRELWFRHPIDAIAIPRVRVFSMPMESDRVEWHGAEQSLEHTGKKVEYAANVSVSSVVVAIFDSKDAPLYVGYGGLEPLMRREGEQLQPLPVEQLLRDEEKIRKATQMAVKAL